MGPDFSLLVSTAGIIIAVRIPFVKNYFPRWRKYFPAGFWRGRRSRVPAFLSIGRNMCVLGGFSGHSHPKRLDSLRRGWYTCPIFGFGGALIPIVPPFGTVFLLS
jgi:hypothetical protein